VGIYGVHCGLYIDEPGDELKSFSNPCRIDEVEDGSYFIQRAE
jgi:hypothetical protein